MCVDMTKGENDFSMIQLVSVFSWSVIFSKL